MKKIGLILILFLLILPNLYAGEDKVKEAQNIALSDLSIVLSKILQHPEAVLLTMPDNFAVVDLWVNEKGEVQVISIKASNPCLQNFVQTRLGRKDLKADRILGNRRIRIQLKMK